MDPQAHDIEDQIEQNHWWFVGRRDLFARLLKGLPLPADARVLDLGCGTGANLRLLKENTTWRVTGLDYSGHALSYCAAKGLPPGVQSDACRLPFADASFDLLLLTDILEHVDDHLALAEVRRVLKPGGLALVAVPAFMSLWGLQDDVSHHLRRYRLGQLKRLLRGAGLRPKGGFYFNFFLFLPIFLARQVIRVLRLPLKSENEVNSPLVNRVLTAVFGLDVRLAPWVHAPFGVSALVLADRP